MKRFSCNDSLTALLYPSQGEVNPKDNSGYSREFQAMLEGLDEEDSIEESGQSSEKKRRLSNHQVKSLEKIFEVDNKLDPERKLKVAQELGLQPRQVAIWFQNRRARWKTKQLERDYTFLKNNYEALKLNFQELEQEKENLAARLKELKGKLSEEKTETREFHSKEKTVFWGSKNCKDSQSSYSIELCGEPEPEPELEPAKTNHEVYHHQCLNLEQINGVVELKDGSSDSDSSGILNEDNTSNLINDQLLISPHTFASPRFDFSSMNYSQFLDSRPVLTKAYQQQQVKMEEQCLVTSSEESCNIFSVDQAPTLCWYFQDQRN